LHTHSLTNAFPGEGDIAGAENGTLLFIYSTRFDELRAFRIKRGSYLRPLVIEKRIEIV
jgi:hypothetical protein